MPKKRNRPQRLNRNKPLSFTERESRIKRQKKSLKFKIITAICMAVVIAALLFWIATAHISSVNIIAHNKALKSELEALTKEKIQTNTRTFFLNEAGLKQYLLKNEPRIDTISVKTRYFDNTLELHVKEREPRVILQSRGMQFFIDEEGNAYNHRTDKKRSNLPLIIDDSGLAITAGEKVLPADFISFVTDIDQVFAAMEKKVSFYRTTGVTSTIIATTKDKTEILFDASTEVDGQIDKLQETYQYINEQSISPTYIDLRTEHKTFIK